VSTTEAGRLAAFGKPDSTSLAGVSLQVVIEAARRLDELSCARVVSNIAGVVHAAQKGGQPLGTLTPAAILVLADGGVKLATGAALPSYAAPEKLRGGTGDRRSDVFSLGIVLWEALAHERLFDGANDDAIKQAVLAHAFRPPSELNANVPAELDAICKKALARDPSDRYQSAKVMAAEIDAVLDDAGYPESNEQIAKYVARSGVPAPAPVTAPAAVLATAPAAVLATAPATPLATPPMAPVLPIPSVVPAPSVLPVVHPPSKTVPLPSVVPSTASVPSAFASRPPAQTVILGSSSPAAEPMPPPSIVEPPLKPVARAPTTPAKSAKTEILGSVAGLPPPEKSSLTVTAFLGSNASTSPAPAPAPMVTAFLGSNASTPLAPAPAPMVTAFLGSNASTAPSTPTIPTILQGGPAAPTTPSSPPPIAPAAPSTPEPAPVPPMAPATPAASAVAPPVAPVASVATDFGPPAMPPPITQPGHAPPVRSAPPTPAPPIRSAPPTPAPPIRSSPPTPAPPVRSSPLTPAPPIVPAHAAPPDARHPLPAPFKPPIHPQPPNKPSIANAETIATPQLPAHLAVPPASPQLSMPPASPQLSMPPGMTVPPVSPGAPLQSSDQEFQKLGQDEHKAEPSKVVALPHAEKTTTGSRDVLAGWGWSTGSVEAIDDEDIHALHDTARAGRKRLLLAIGGALGVVLIVAVAAFAFSGSKQPNDQEQSPRAAKSSTAAPISQVTAPSAEPGVTPPAAPSNPVPEPPRAEPTPPPPDPAKAEPPASEPPKPEPSHVEPPVAEPPKTEPPKKLEAKKPPEPKKPDKAVKRPLPPDKLVKATAKPPADKAQPLDPYAAPADKPKADPAAAYRTGLQQYARGDTTGALATLRTSLSSSPTFAPTWRGLGLVYEKLGNKGQARAAFKRYLQLAPDAGDADQIRDRLERLGS
jgi:serine/threonine protein kinase